ncbi:MAG: hypothetical protein GF313_16780 [Caldithrix sp.]|nr:hypothetical protein [Caldithrix sp.]
MMTIDVIDKTDHRLLLAVPMLSSLNALAGQKGWNIRLHTGPGVNASLFGVFSGVEAVTGKKQQASGQVQCILTDHPQHYDVHATANILYYPIVTEAVGKDGIPQPAASIQASIIPLSPPKADEGGYRTGDIASTMDMISRLLNPPDFKDKKILISAGPTVEDIDPVRFISNRSSGKMGIALARAAFVRGADVRLVMGPSVEPPPQCLNVTYVRSARDMDEAIGQHFFACHVYIGAAAVADYRPRQLKQHKIKKSEGDSVLHLQRTTDILSRLKSMKHQQIMVGFSVETEDLIEHSRDKLHRKGLDMIVANNPGIKGAAFAGDTNQVSIIHRNGDVQTLPMMSKPDTAHAILDQLLNYGQGV